MVLKQPFTTASSIIASYSFTDIAEGTGVVKFNGFTSKEETTIDYHLTTSSVYSNEIEIRGITTSQSFVRVLDLDFDLSAFNFPKTVNGTAIINFAINVTGDAASGAPASGYFIVKVRKWDGTTETDLGSAQSGTYTGDNATPTKKIICLKIPLSLTNFKQGDTLRLTMEGWLKRNTGSGTGWLYLGHDPRNRDDTGLKPSTDVPDTITTLEAYIPFRIEV